MIKKVPYTSNLISIGNSPHYDGQLVYSDGRVAYGWQYNVQQPTLGINRKTAGLWVCAERMPYTGNSYYVLMDENLNFGDVAIRGFPDPYENIYNWYCYPWACCTWSDYSENPKEQGEMIFSSDNHYHFVGNIVRMGPGEILTYYEDYDDTLGQYTHYYLCSYSNDGSVVKTDLKPLYDQYHGFRNWYQISAGQGGGMAKTITALDTQGGYITVENPDPQAGPDEKYIHFYCANGTCTETQFPTQMILSNKAKILLPSLDLVVNGTTYSNDYLELLDTNSHYWWNGANVNGVHAYNDIVISQFSNDPYGDGYLFKDGTLYDHFSFRNWETGEGVSIEPIWCWSLAEIIGGQWNIDYNPYE